MGRDMRAVRVLIYSHDSFGLGHLRRCRAIAHSLVREHKGMSVLILSGSPIIGSFDFRTRVDFVRVPGVIKLRNGEYTSLSLNMDIKDTLAVRASIIRHTADVYRPDLFLVDKEPLGLRGEVRDTLEMLKERGTPLVLGLRDVMDEPSALAPEWERKRVLPALHDLYDSIWVYGLPQFCDPLEGIELSSSVYRKVTYTGYLGQDPSAQRTESSNASVFTEPFLLVTPGGGGDGGDLIDWVLSAYELERKMPIPALIVYGPFLSPEQKAAFQARVERLERVRAITFDAHMEDLVARAAGVVAMGGYNTFCEILSFDKRALIVPRTVPRREQYIRISRAHDMGLIKMLEDDGARDPWRMVTALRHLPQQARPSDVVVPGLLDGLNSLNRLVGKALEGAHRRPRMAVAKTGR
jgi:predicted glycosyltransferase